jgi:dTDP-D-glucose 4,6-dehydratase
VNYREAYGMHVSNGILFNHESPRRPGNFVTRKITTGVAHIVEGLQETLYLGNLNASRDWGHARDFIEGMWLMLQQEEAGDYVLASGESHSVREFVECAFKYAGVSIKWLGPSGTVDEIGVEEGNEGRVMVAVDPRFFRPTECNMVQGDPTKAKTKLGWVSKTSFDGLVNEMMEADLALVKEEVKASESRTVGESRIEKSTSATFEACRSTKSSFITIDEESTYTVENPTPSKNQRAFHVLSNENQGEDDIRDVLSTELSNDNQGEDEKREEATVA